MVNEVSALINSLHQGSIKRIPLGTIATIERGNGLQKKDLISSGIGCIHYGQIYTKYSTFTETTISFVDAELASKLKKVHCGDLIIAVTSENIEDVCKCIAWMGDEDIVTGGHTAIIRHSQNPKYLAYWFQTEDFRKQKYNIAHGTKVIEVTPKHLENVLIPLHSLEIQDEIVRILDCFASLTAELTAELTARKLQYEFYRDKLLSFDHLTPEERERRQG